MLLKMLAAKVTKLGINSVLFVAYLHFLLIIGAAKVLTNLQKWADLNTTRKR